MNSRVIFNLTVFISLISLCLFVSAYEYIYKLHNPYLQAKKRNGVDLLRLPVTDLVASKLAFATSGIAPFDLALFGNSRSIMVGTGELRLKQDTRFFNFSVGGTSFLQSVRSLEYLAELGVPPKVAVVAFDNTVVQFVGLPYWPHPFFEPERSVEDIRFLMAKSDAGFGQRLRSAKKLANYYVFSSWDNFKLLWSIASFQNRFEHFRRSREAHEGQGLPDRRDGSRAQTIPDAPPDLSEFRPAAAAPPAWNTYYWVGLRRLARVAEVHGVRIIVFETPLAPELSRQYRSQPTAAAAESRKWIERGCHGTALECHAAPVLTAQDGTTWPDCCHAPARLLGEYISTLLSAERPG